ncbi:MAG TPA: AAA family ATPase, partial [Kiritimatiellia bacterium]|nr:AAA family ATPase [Kiritimatiellia bacterium]
MDETIEILKGLRSRYEEHHHARISDEAIKAAATLSARYISDRFLPDKAIDVIDEAGSRSRISSMMRPPNVKDAEDKIAEIRKQKEDAIRAQKFEAAAAFRDQERDARKEVDRLLEEWRKARDEKIVTITAEDVMHILSKWTGVPLVRMEDHEMNRLLGMEKELEKSVIGQHEAVSAISRALRRSRADLKDPRRPIGSFIFLGPTGVGKTLLAKVLAEFMFDDPDALIQIDMSEYMEKFASSRLVGSPPGYVGYGEGGQLTEQVRRRPYSVVLFDEAEKAHPDVMHMLLQILEEGKLTDSLGRTVDFRNTVVILTSNLGADFIQKGAGLGFGETTAGSDFKKLEAKMTEESKKVFKPELLNRIDKIIVFHQLLRDDVMKILEVELVKVLKRLDAKNIRVQMSDAAKDFL